MNLKSFYYLFVFLFYISVFSLNAQPWVENYKIKENKDPIQFFERQKAFNDYWGPKNVGKDGYYFENGVRKKAVGWKQFRRWEYNMLHKIDLKTGLLPELSAQQIFDRYLEKLPIGERSTIANWTSLGTSYSDGGYAGIGRLNCVAFHPTISNTYWVGAPAGGLWKTIDNGASWTCLTDNNNVLGVSDIIINSDYSTSNTIYIATGDRDAGDNYTIGVLKSTDGGVTWNSTGLSFSQSSYDQINRLLVDPNNTQILLAATTDGVYKTTNGGTSWTLLNTTSFKDMEYKPGDFNTIYGSTTDGKIYYSTNGGSSWTNAIDLYSAGGRRIELAVSSNQSAWVYAIVAKSDDGLYGIYKSTNSGTSYSQVFAGSTKNLLGWSSTGSDTGGQGWYDLAIAASPTDANILLVGGINTWRSTNGGTSWTIVNHWTGTGAQAVHADKHNLRYRSDGSLFEVNDGGVYLSTNNGTNWTDKSDGLVISQMYKLGISKTVASEVITGLQDNGTKLLAGGLWEDVIGGDGMECLIDYTNVSVQYGSLYYGEIERTLNHWSSSTTISPSSAGDGAWVTPYIIDPVINTTLYAGYSDVWKSTNQGTSWTKISTMNSSDKLRSLAVAPSNTQVIYAADRTHIWKTINGGTNWTNITGSLPVSTSSITSIAVKANDANTVWITFSQFNLTRVYQSTDGGTTWTNISTGLPQIPVYSIVQNTQMTAETHLYVGTELGVYFKKGTNNWVLYNTGLPNVLVYELEIYYNSSNPSLSKLRAATFGRGLWESNVYYEEGSIPVTVPTNVQASDGTYSDKVYITWSGTAGNYFKVYRNTSNNSSTAVELGSWQSAMNFSDLTAVTNTTYYYWVKAASDVNGTGASAFSTSDSGWKNGVTVPTNVQASDGTYADKVYITWSGTSGNYFKVYRNTSNNSSTAVELGSWQSAMNFSDLTAVTNITYYYWLKAASDANGSNASAFSTSDTGWKNSVTVPTNVQASDGTYIDKVSVTWSGTSGNYFRVYRNTSNNSSTATALSSWQTPTNYNDASAVANTVYYYWVKAATDANGSGASSFSTSDSGWKMGVTVPTNVQASDGTYTDKIYITWSGSTGNYFRVYRNTTNNSSTASALGSWQTSMNYSDNSVSTNVTYYYWVKAASNSSGSNASAFSSSDSGWRSNGTIAPTNVQASDGTYSNKVVITWNGTNGNYFRVFRSTTNNSGSATVLGNWQTSMTFNDYGAVANTTYYYWVKAATSSSGANQSGFSNPDTGWRSGSIARPDENNDALAGELVISPNPIERSHDLVIETSDLGKVKNYRITDYTGKIVDENQNIEQSNTFTIKSPENFGVYILIFTTYNGDLVVRKLIVE